MYSVNHYTDGTSVVESCNIKKSTVIGWNFSCYQFACRAYFENANVTGITFDHIEITAGSMSFDDVNLTKSSWIAVDTSKISFWDVNFTDANITLDQLAQAEMVAANCTFPEGIDYRAIMERRKQLGLNAFTLSEPAPR